MTDIIVVKGDPGPEEVAALTVALLAVATVGACRVVRPRSGPRRPPAVGHARAVVPSCGCA